MSIHEVEILRAACCVAGIDGNIDEREGELIQRLADRCGVGPASVQAMRARAESDSNFYKEQFKYLSTDPDSTIAALLKVAAADGSISTEEKAMIGEFARRLEMTDERFDELVARAGG